MTSVSCAKCGLVSWAAEGAPCKRCGAPAGAGAARPRPSAPQYVAAAEAGGHSRPCLHCGHTVHLSKWDDWNGFLVECQHCGGLYGKRWNIRRVMMASFMFNALSFLFTMRPGRGVPCLLAFAAATVAGSFFIERLPDMVQVTLVSAFILGPMLVNGVVLVNHERSIDNSAPPELMLRA
jgi:hypothetical protein